LRCLRRDNTNRIALEGLGPLVVLPTVTLRRHHRSEPSDPLGLLCNRIGLSGRYIRLVDDVLRR
jgi:hypothetical protein